MEGTRKVFNEGKISQKPNDPTFSRKMEVEKLY